MSNDDLMKALRKTNAFSKQNNDELQEQNSQLSQTYEDMFPQFTSGQLIQKCISLIEQRDTFSKRVNILTERNEELTGQIAKLTSKAIEVLKLKKFAEQQKKPKQKIPLDMMVILDLKRKGYSNVRISKLMGVSESTIRNRLAETLKDDDLL